MQGVAIQLASHVSSHSLGDSRMFTLLLLWMSPFWARYMTLLVCLPFHDKKSYKWIFEVILLSHSNLALAIFIFDYKNVLNANLTPPNGMFRKSNPFVMIRFCFHVGERSFSRNLLLHALRNVTCWDQKDYKVILWTSDTSLNYNNNYSNIICIMHENTGLRSDWQTQESPHAWLAIC